MDLGSIFQAAAIGVPSLIAAAATIKWAATSLFTIDQSQQGLITQFGKHVRTQTEPGLHVKAPWPFQKVAKISTALHQVEEKLDTKTKDDLFVKLPIAIQFEVTNPAKYYFENRNAIDNMKKAVSAAVRTSTSSKDFQELYSDRDEISDHVIAQIKPTVDEYGITLRRIIIDEPAAPPEVQTSFNEVRASERLMEASKNKAASHKIELVAKAEAEKEADILRGQGKAGFRKALFDQYGEQIENLVGKGVTREEAIKVMLDTMHQDTMRDIGHQGNMVIVTTDKSSDIGGGLAALQTLRPKQQPAREQDTGTSGAAVPALAP